jgi:Mg2+ and Co2+ transporter CorA
MERVFHFHPLALEDCASSQVHAPKVDDFGDHLFIIVHDIDCTSGRRQLVTPTLSLLR